MSMLTTSTRNTSFTQEVQVLLRAPIHYHSQVQMALVEKHTHTTKQKPLKQTERGVGPQEEGDADSG